MLTSALGVFSVWIKIVRIPPALNTVSKGLNFVVCGTDGLHPDVEAGILRDTCNARELQTGLRGVRASLPIAFDDFGTVEIV